MKVKKVSFQFTVFRLKDESEVELSITVEYTPGHSGHRDRYGCPMEPDEPPTYEIISCIDSAGTEYDADNDFQEGDRDRIFESAKEFFFEDVEKTINI